jgi:hypothetical protein
MASAGSALPTASSTAGAEGQVSHGPLAAIKIDFPEEENNE